VIDVGDRDHVRPIDYAAKLSKCDLHGALVTGMLIHRINTIAMVVALTRVGTVVRSKNPSDIGTQGIIAQEQQNVFRIVCTDDRVRGMCATCRINSA
jgi:hypothetical protein